MSAKSVNWSQCLAWSAETDVGMRRSNNQDSNAVVLAGDVEGYLRRGHLFIVADGMGAHAAGELASKLSVDTIPHLYHKHKEFSPPEALVAAIQEANAEIHRRGNANADFHNMGTTTSALIFLPQGAFVGHVGDSRVYRLHGDVYEQLTFDHSLVWELKHSTPLGQSLDITGVVPTNVITRSLGPKEHVQVDIEGPIPLELNDTFLLCSDGLSGLVHDDEMGAILASMPPKEATKALIDLANLRGGPDNVTVIVAKVTGKDLVTGAVAVDPIVVGGERTERTVHPGIWVALGVCFIAAFLLAAIGQQWAALTAGIGAIAMLTVVILQLYGGLGKGEVALVGGRKLGKAPYVETSARPGPEVIGKLKKMLDDLSSATSGEDWSIDRDRLGAHTTKAEAALAANNYPVAVREYAHALSFMMQELRSQKSRKTSDSGIDL